MSEPPQQLDLFDGLAPLPRLPAPPAAPIQVPKVHQNTVPYVAAPQAVHERRIKAQQLANRLAQAIQSPAKLRLLVHDNRSTMMSFRREGAILTVRLHHMFLDATDEVVNALGHYATGQNLGTASCTLDDFIHRHQDEIRALRRKGEVLESRGECFDLRETFDRLNEQFFQSNISARIGWGRSGPKRRRRSIRLGVYDHKAREIRIHPSLDKPQVPKFFLEFIVFHEMLHQLFPSARDSGKHVHHPKAFRDREKSFPKYAEALAWEAQHLSELLRG